MSINDKNRSINKQKFDLGQFNIEKRYALRTPEVVTDLGQLLLEMLDGVASDTVQYIVLGKSRKKDKFLVSFSFSPDDKEYAGGENLMDLVIELKGKYNLSSVNALDALEELD